AMAFFTEKYGDMVRVVDVPGVSLELCGGTHVPSTGQISLFRFTHETGAAAGVRRIEAVTGPAAYQLVRRLAEQLEQAAAVLKAQPEHLVRRIEALVDENRKLEKRVQELLEGGAVRTSHRPAPGIPRSSARRGRRRRGSCGGSSADDRGRGAGLARVAPSGAPGGALGSPRGGRDGSGRGAPRPPLRRGSRAARARRREPPSGARTGPRSPRRGRVRRVRLRGAGGGRR